MSVRRSVSLIESKLSASIGEVCFFLTFSIYSAIDEETYILVYIYPMEQMFIFKLLVNKVDIVSHFSKLKYICENRKQGKQDLNRS